MECIDSRTQHFTQAFPFDCGAHAANRVRGRAVANANANASFSLVHATGSTYKQFISDLRKALTVNSQIVYGIPVLPDPTGLARFILVNLTNYNGESITVAIKVVDAYVVAYQAGNKAYFLNDVYDELRQVLFKGTESVRLPFKGNYDDLERRAGSREKIDLGFSELGSAIGNLFHYNNKDVTSAARGFIVIIQTLAEAARFKYIEQRVSENVESKFKPDPAFLSLENRWKDLSKQILLAQKHGGKFEHPVPVRSVSNKPILVKDVSSPVVKGIALLRNTSKEDGPIHLMMMEQCFEQWEDARGDFGVDF